MYWNFYAIDGVIKNQLLQFVVVAKFSRYENSCYVVKQS
jgi:hypothetical protein